VPAPVIKRYDENLVLGFIERMAMVYFPAKSPSLAEITAMQAHLLQGALQFPEGFGLVLLVPEAGGPPEGAARDVASEMFKAVKGRLKVICGVLEGAGFAAAAKRSVLTVLVNVAAGGAAVKVFSAVPPGCEWASTQAKTAGVACPAAIDLRATLELMRSA
jgi:hypothetical protein